MRDLNKRLNWIEKMCHHNSVRFVLFEVLYSPEKFLLEGVTKKTTCLRDLKATRPYKAAQPKLILALSTIVYEQNHTAKINISQENTIF